MVVVGAIGIFTAILAASIAFTQTDIKRVLAFSTLSQLGYMFAALGVGRVDRGDLPPHDPRLLQGPAVPGLGIGDPRGPRGAGHEPHGRACGGRSRSPTGRCSSARSRSRASRRSPASSRRTRSSADAYKNGSYWIWAIGLTVAVMTAFYMWRLMGKTFYGPSHVDPAVEPKIHESAVADDAAADPARDPVAVPRHHPHLAGPAARAAVRAPGPAGPPDDLAGAGLRGLERLPRPDQRDVPDRRHRRRPDPDQRRRRDHRPRVRHLAVRGLPQRRPPADGRAHRVRQPRDAVPVPRVAQQVVVRRPQPPAVHRARRQGRRGRCGGSTGSSSTAR